MYTNRLSYLISAKLVMLEEKNMYATEHKKWDKFFNTTYGRSDIIDYGSMPRVRAIPKDPSPPQYVYIDCGVAQPPTQWLQGSFPGPRGRSVNLTTHLHLVHGLSAAEYLVPSNAFTE